MGNHNFCHCINQGKENVAWMVVVVVGEMLIIPVMNLVHFEDKFFSCVSPLFLTNFVANFEVILIFVLKSHVYIVCSSTKACMYLYDMHLLHVLIFTTYYSGLHLLSVW